MGVGGDAQTRGVGTTGLQAINLIKEGFEVNHHTVAKHWGGVFGENTGRKELKLILLTADHDGVAGVITAVGLDYVIDLAAEDIGGLALAFVAPLGADNDDRCHVWSHFLVIEVKYAPTLPVPVSRW